MPTKHASVTFAPPTRSDSQPPNGRETDPISAPTKPEAGEVRRDERVAGEELRERVLDHQRQRERVADERAERADVEDRHDPRLRLARPPSRTTLVSDFACVRLSMYSHAQIAAMTMSGIHIRPA